MIMITVLNKLPKKLLRTRDAFTTARAAGAVHGTACEPGPSTRTVIDTDHKLKIGA